MACSIKTGYPSSPFKAEYILSQIIFQWAKNNMNIGARKIIGVCYSSTYINNRSENFHGYFYNTAIPIQQSCENGYCEVLTDKFCLTQPIAFHEALKFEKEVEQQGQVKSLDLFGFKVDYVATDFGKIEQVLSEKPYSDLYFVTGESVINE